MTEAQKQFYVGFSIAVGTLARMQDQPSMAVDIMETNGVTLRQLIQAGAEEFDLKAIRKEIRNRKPLPR